MEQLRLKLKESFENVSQDPKVAAQMAPFLNDDFRSMMEDTEKFREEIQKVRERGRGDWWLWNSGGGVGCGCSEQ
jgi:hypothetical protein